MPSGYHRVARRSSHSVLAAQPTPPTPPGSPKAGREEAADDMDMGGLKERSLHKEAAFKVGKIHETHRVDRCAATGDEEDLPARTPASHRSVLSAARLSDTSAPTHCRNNPRADRWGKDSSGKENSFMGTLSIHRKLDLMVCSALCLSYTVTSACIMSTAFRVPPLPTMAHVSYGGTHHG